MVIINSHRGMIPMQILVTGGAGFIGLHLAERIAARNDVLIIDNFSSGSVENISGIANKVQVIKKT